MAWLLYAPTPPSDPCALRVPGYGLGNHGGVAPEGVAIRAVFVRRTRHLSAYRIYSIAQCQDHARRHAVAHDDARWQSRRSSSPYPTVRQRDAGHCHCEPTRRQMGRCLRWAPSSPTARPKIRPRSTAEPDFFLLEQNDEVGSTNEKKSLCVLSMAGSRDLATTASKFSRSRCRWVARAILPRAVARPDVPAPEEAEGRGRGADMVGFNNQ
jgi:hypothetical protein